MHKFNWITSAYWTQLSRAGWEMLTDEVPGLVKTRTVNIDHVQALEHGMNHGLDSWIDVRLAMLLFHTVYRTEGASMHARLAVTC
jgi:hypothetical protein